MFINIFLKAINNIFPMLFIITVILVSIRLTYLIYNKKKIVLYKELLMLFFIFYILLLYYIISFQDNNYGTNNFIPFKEIFRYKITSRLFIRNVLGNIILFIPLGIFITYYIKNKTFLITVLLSLLISCSIELAQSIIGRTCDVDDVILNTIGGLFGYLIYLKGNLILNKVPKFMKSQIFLDIIAIISILIVIYMLFKMEFWRIFV